MAIRIKTAEPWSVMKARGAGRNVQRSGMRKANAGGGDNAARTKMNRNKSGSKSDPTIKGAPNHSAPSGSKEVPSYSRTPKGRNPSGSHTRPKINRKEPSKRSY